jgi:hypothetical protein
MKTKTKEGKNDKRRAVMKTITSEVMKTITKGGNKNDNKGGNENDNKRRNKNINNPSFVFVFFTPLLSL